MPKQPRPLWPIVTAGVAVLCFIVILPSGWKQTALEPLDNRYTGWAHRLLMSEVHLGLDLAGGTQLDFRISEDEISQREQELKTEIDTLKNQGGGTNLRVKEYELQNVQNQHLNLVEAIRTVLERRINSLGVSEATITPSYFGAEKHLLVECPGVVDVQKCIATVGKTIQLEFKEEYSGSNTDYEQKVRENAENAYRAVLSATGSLLTVGQDLSGTLGVAYTESQDSFVSDLPSGLKPFATRRTIDPALKTEGTHQVVAQDEQGDQQIKEVKGIYVSKALVDPTPATHTLTDTTQALEELGRQKKGLIYAHGSAVSVDALSLDLATEVKTGELGSLKVIEKSGSEAWILHLAGRTEGEQVASVSHILVSYRGAQRAETGVIRTKAEAQKRAKELRDRVNSGENFTALARAESDGPSRARGGKLGDVRMGQLAPSFEVAAFALKKGELSEVVETPFGYHIIRADAAARRTNTRVTYDQLRVRGAKAADTAKQLLADVQGGKVVRTENKIVLRHIFFSLEPTGWKDTPLNGQRFRAASVTADPVTNIPVVQIQFDEEGGKMFADLTKRNVGKRIAIFVGGELVTAPTVNGEILDGTAIITGSRTIQEADRLATDLNTGAIPAPIYLSGQSTIEAALGSDALNQSVFAGLVGFLVLCALLILIYRMMGVMATLALSFYIILLIASTKLPLFLVSDQYVVLTLAGIAGIILSVGMAVDANVLAFERIKEEVRRGKTLKTSVETGFKRAWPSVRDGNTSTLITCAILFVIGTSIVRGFAVTLAIGIFISLFTAIVVTRWLMRKLVSTPMGERLELFGIKETKSSGGSRGFEGLEGL